MFVVIIEFKVSFKLLLEKEIRDRKQNIVREMINLCFERLTMMFTGEQVL